MGGFQHCNTNNCGLFPNPNDSENLLRNKGAQIISERWKVEIEPSIPQSCNNKLGLSKALPPKEDAVEIWEGRSAKISKPMGNPTSIFVKSEEKLEIQLNQLAKLDI